MADWKKSTTFYECSPNKMETFQWYVRLPKAKATPFFWLRDWNTSLDLRVIFPKTSLGYIRLPLLPYLVADLVLCPGDNTCGSSSAQKEQLQLTVQTLPLTQQTSATWTNLVPQFSAIGLHPFHKKQTFFLFFVLAGCCKQNVFKNTYPKGKFPSTDACNIHMTSTVHVAMNQLACSHFLLLRFGVMISVIYLK